MLRLMGAGEPGEARERLSGFVDCCPRLYVPKIRMGQSKGVRNNLRIVTTEFTLSDRKSLESGIRDYPQSLTSPSQSCP